MTDNETILHVADLLRDAVRFRHPADGKHVECDFTFPAEWCDLVEKVLRASAQDARRLIKPAKALIDESGFGYEEGAIYSSQKAAHELGEPDAWLVPWCRANGDAGTNVYVKKSDAENAAKNLEKYSRSETTADVIPLYAHPPAQTGGNRKEPFTAADAWDELVHKDDRTSPEDYPEMCLITADELRDFMERAAPPSHPSTNLGSGVRDV